MSDQVTEARAQGARKTEKKLTASRARPLRRLHAARLEFLNGWLALRRPYCDL